MTSSIAKPKSSLLDAAHAELVAADTPLSVAEITSRMLASGAWSTDGKTPEATVASRLAVDVKQRGEDSRFIRVAPNTYGLRAWPAAKARGGKVGRHDDLPRCGREDP